MPKTTLNRSARVPGRGRIPLRMAKINNNQHMIEWLTHTIDQFETNDEVMIFLCVQAPGQNFRVISRVADEEVSSRFLKVCKNFITELILRVKSGLNESSEVEEWPDIY